MQSNPSKRYQQLQPEDRVTLASLVQQKIGVRAMAPSLGAISEHHQPRTAAQCPPQRLRQHIRPRLRSSNGVYVVDHSWAALSLPACEHTQPHIANANKT